VSSGTDELFPLMRFADAALPVLQDRLRAVVDNEAGTREGSDIEHLHDMRVASRRLRAALTAFRDCFPAKNYRPVRAMAARLTRSLGAVRDLDVLLAELRKLNAKVSVEEQAGFHTLITALEAERAAARPLLLQTLDYLHVHGFRHKVLSLGRQARGHGGPLQAHARRQCVAGLAELYGYAPYVHDEARDKELHEMRIAAKRLRYGMEIFRACFGPDIADRIDDVKAIQDKIGQIHDGDVLIGIAREQGLALASRQFTDLAALAATPMKTQERVATLRASLTPPQGSDPRLGILTLLGKKVEERRARYTDFIRWWDEQDSAGLRGKLYACLTVEAGREGDE
jgi:CHAD domain-containing protein